MDKLVERETAPRNPLVAAPALAVQFFLIPLAVVGVTVMVYVEDVDDVFDRAIKAGATEDRKVENQFYGDRAGAFVDPFGHKWFVATHVEDVPEEEMKKRVAAAMAG